VILRCSTQGQSLGIDSHQSYLALKKEIAMSQNNPPKPRPLPQEEVQRQVRQAKQLVREAGRTLTKLAEKTRVVLIEQQDAELESSP
jgi:hypothetical protein